MISPWNGWRQHLARRNAPVKALLLEQSVAAGLGNLYADEALYLSGIRPTRPASATNRRRNNPSAARHHRLHRRRIRGLRPRPRPKLARAPKPKDHLEPPPQRQNPLPPMPRPNDRRQNPRPRHLVLRPMPAVARLPQRRHNISEWVPVRDKISQSPSHRQTSSQLFSMWHSQYPAQFPVN